MAFAYGKLAEIMERTYNIRYGLDPDNVKPINPYHLAQRYDEKFANVYFDKRKVGIHKALHMGLILRSEGIQRRKVCDLYTFANNLLFLFSL